MDVARGWSNTGDASGAAAAGRVASMKILITSVLSQLVQASSFFFFLTAAPDMIKTCLIHVSE